MEAVGSELRARWFCDMDGVLVKQIGSEGFDEMPWHPNGKTIWHALAGMRPTLLSLAPEDRLARAYLEKRRWVDHQLGIGVALIVIPKTLAKAAYCIKGDVLIDDSERNCAVWSLAGGIAVLHRSIEETLSGIMKAKWRTDADRRVR